MRPLFLAAIVLLIPAAGLRAQNATTALSALKLLPKGEGKRIARIEAREGSPTPERWYILVHNPKEETGLHEYVVAGGEIIASRALSQFAENVKPEDVIGNDAVKIDSDLAGQMAQDFAEANNLVAASLNYQLKKDNENAPTWTVTCIDQGGKRLGEVVVAAGKGSVLSHSGFPVEPSPDKLKLPGDSIEERDRARDRELSKSARKKYVTRYRDPAQSRPPPREPPKPVPFFQRLFGGGR
ncbi:MAG: hypothetical protein QOE70_5270 [Chthoniobacter sp.]|jgi:hypothetical protein|nr:hypothetical protein [Chthoniobacter sp.]